MLAAKSKTNPTALRTLQDPSKPMGAVSAFFLYFQENRQSIVDANPNVKFGEIVRNVI
jgi:hypothetical protein